MKSFYKYMPYSTLIKFLQDPCLRVTPSSCQNDPFEFGFSLSDIEMLNAKTNSNDLGRGVEDFAKLHGVISLTTSKDNILMWSHYADSHTGAVVEIKLNLDNPQSLFINSTGVSSPPFNYADFIFDKVSYKKKRGCDDSEFGSNLNQIKKHYYFTKAEQWSYEKEYRFVTPMHWINRILLNDAGYKVARDILGKYFSSINCIETSQAGRKIYELNSVVMDLIFIKDFELIGKLWLESSGNDIMFFIRLNSGCPGIDPGQIGGIFLGCRTNDVDFLSRLKKYRRSINSIVDNYVHPISGRVNNVFQAGIDKNKYKILFKPLIINDLYSYLSNVNQENKDRK